MFCIFSDKNPVEPLDEAKQCGEAQDQILTCSCLGTFYTTPTWLWRKINRESWWWKSAWLLWKRVIKQHGSNTVTCRENPERTARSLVNPLPDSVSRAFWSIGFVARVWLTEVMLWFNPGFCSRLKSGTCMEWWYENDLASLQIFCCSDCSVSPERSRFNSTAK